MSGERAPETGAEPVRATLLQRVHQWGPLPGEQIRRLAADTATSLAEIDNAPGIPGPVGPGGAAGDLGGPAAPSPSIGEHYSVPPTAISKGGCRMDSTVAFTLRIPESWFEFDIWRATRTGDLARLVDARVAAHPELEPYRGALIKALREAAETAEAQGAVYCASMLEKVEDDGVLAANLMVFHTEGSPGGCTAEEIASQVSITAHAEDAARWRHVEILDLPAGRAVRVKGVNGFVTMQTLIPVPGQRGVLDIVLTSPQIDLAEPFLDLFEAVSGTLAWPDSRPR